MRNTRILTAAIGGLAAVAIGLAGPAGAAPDGPGDAQQTISRLQSQGYTVIVNRLGTTPLDQAAVVAVRPGPHYSRTDSLSAVTQRTVYVDVK
ncbi:hypothetical protein A5733_10055 [Mycobacterium sp. NS-7484]|uniref:hypothetical protein n=1 Tax=Mycobacterium sp. NS-7484 TaxID=1834161 RepID=UPI00096EAF31|nr:hypothetical protein [Mycobacterium sp. NS-7484]OMB97381.1 hypothetical protein A5733_10055 [Mycobacterium sp. NS-7484]